MLITKWGKALDKNHPLCYAALHRITAPQFIRLDT